MDARFTIAAVVAAFCSLGASHRTTNFVVTADSKSFAVEVAETAEKMRADLAQKWLGKQLPPWRSPCPIRVNASPSLGAGGATSFMFENGRPFGWRMTIQGSQERILDSVLPHEITHTIFATHFGRPLPRWADEGACTTVEHESERRTQHRFLIRFLNEERGIPFNKMFRIREYPRDVMPLYSQGYSVVRYLLRQGGERKFVEFLGYGMQTTDWDGAVERFYGFENLSDLQISWVAWVKDGSPLEIASRTEPSPEAETAAEGVSLASATSPLPPQADPAPPRSLRAATLIRELTGAASSGSADKSGSAPVRTAAASSDTAGESSRGGSGNYYVLQARQAASNGDATTTFRNPR